MKHIQWNRRFLAAAVGMTMFCTAVPVSLFTAWTADAADGAVLYSADFENGTNDFTARGTTETFEITTEKVHSGSYALKVNDRSSSWNGPQLALDSMISTGTEYVVTTYATTEWYCNSLTLSLQYDDASGNTTYSNVVSQTSDGSGWVEFNSKISFPSGSTNQYVYFECSDAGAAIYLDDFTLSEAPEVELEDIPALSEVYDGYFKIGTAITPSTLASKTQMKLVQKHFSGSITLGNEMKPDYVLDQEATLAYMEQTGDDNNPQINLSACAEILQYCSDNNIPVRGHTLIWHSQTPDWFFKEGFTDEGDWVSKETMIVRMENYIKNYMEALETQFPNLNLYAFDVVNEAWTDNGTPREAGSSKSEDPNSSAWVRVFGDNSFIEYAFQFAREYAPEGCKLYYNDFNEYMPAKTNAIVEMATELKEKGLIDGIGLQSHLDVSFPSVSAYRTALEKFAATGLDIQITELDVTTSDTSEAGLEKQAQYYSDIFDAIVEYKDFISAVVLWGTTDDGSWRADRLPLLFNGDYTAKPAYYAIIDDVPPLGGETTTTTTTEESTAPAETTTTTTEESTAPAETTTTTTEPIITAIRGDVNQNGKLEGADLSLMRQTLLTLDTTADLSDTEWIVLDMNQDGMVGTPDLVALLQFLLGQA